MTLKRFIYGETFFGTDVTLSSCGNTYGLKIQLHTVNHYPPCSEPSLTLGITKHSDPYLITILLQDDVSGLQVFKDGEWIAVEALPHAFVINVGYQLQIISNGKLKSSEHRAVTNSDHARTSAAFFVAPSDEIGVAVRSGKMPNPTLNEADEGKEWFEL
ncbi:protein DOWNY MILDEW RESISTANCE [Trifolium repens]|nr:protein DOWNY MILDEW RESISTANCE [Trifolium repens]